MSFFSGLEKESICACSVRCECRQNEHYRGRWLFRKEDVGGEFLYRWRVVTSAWNWRYHVVFPRSQLSVLTANCELKLTRRKNMKAQKQRFYQWDRKITKSWRQVVKLRLLTYGIHVIHVHWLHNSKDSKRQRHQISLSAIYKGHDKSFRCTFLFIAFLGVKNTCRLIISQSAFSYIYS